MVTHKPIINHHKILMSLCTCVLVLLCGCKDTKARKAAAKAAQAKAELVKARANIVQLKGETSYLKEQLRTTEQARDKLLEQLNAVLEEHDVVTDNTQKEIDKLKAELEEQTNKANELQKQLDQLKAVIRELQTVMEQKSESTTQPTEQEAEQPPPDSPSEINL